MSRSSMKSISTGLIGAVTLGVLSAGTAAPAAESGAAQGDGRALAGWWVINEDLSDDPRPQPGGMRHAFRSPHEA